MDELPFSPTENDQDGLCSPGLYQWETLLNALDAEAHGLGAAEIIEVEACCIFSMFDFESADFVIRTKHDRRFHLQGSIDGDTGSDAVAISVKHMETGQLLPFQPVMNDPSTYWSRETGVFNETLEDFNRTTGV